MLTDGFLDLGLVDRFSVHVAVVLEMNLVVTIGVVDLVGALN